MPAVNKLNTTLTSPVGVFMQTFGPQAFGVCSLLLIWYMIVAPELARNKTDYTEFNRGAEMLRETSRATSATSIVLERAAVVLKETTERLERIVSIADRDE